MSNDLPINIAVAPFPEGFQGDMDETFQQAAQNTTATVQGNFIQGLVLPAGSTLPTSDQGPIAMGGTWYFWDPTTNTYQAQSVIAKPVKNYAKNCCYQVAQNGAAFTVGAGITQTVDMALVRATNANILAISADTGPLAGLDNDYVPAAMKYTVGPTLAPTLAATDLYAHEHLIEGSDIIMLQGQVLALSFSVYATVAGTYSAYLTNNGRDYSYVVNFTITSGQLNSWVRIKVPSIPAFPTAGTWSYAEGVTGLYLGIPMGVGSQWQTANLAKWQSGFFAGSAANINLLTVVNNQLKITGVKLEAASTPTYLQVLPSETDFAEMERYFHTTFDYQSSTSGLPIISSANNATTVIFSQLFPRRMAKLPTVVPYGWTTHAAGNITNTSSGTDVACATLPTTRKGVAGPVAAAGAAKSDTFGAIIKADARLS